MIYEFKKSNVSLFFLLVIFFIALGTSSRYFLDFNQLYYQALSNKLSIIQIKEFIELQNKWQWVAYLIIPLLLAIKISLISAVIYMGLFFVNKDLAFKKIFSLVTIAEFVFVAAGVIKLVWFLFQYDYTLQDIQYFYPLSALNIVGYEGLSPWFIYPFQVLNLFELTYWFVLAYLIGKELNIGTEKGFTIVASSYGPALLIWVVAIMFFTLNVS